MASLDVLNGSRAGLSHAIAREAMIIGRGEQCELTLPEQTVSRQHARVYSIGDSYYIEDFGSRNGTFVNGQLICGPVQLHDNDRITIDTIALRFRTRALAEIMGEPATGNRQAGWAGPAGPGRLGWAGWAGRGTTKSRAGARRHPCCRVYCRFPTT